MIESLDDARFSWIREARPNDPWRIIPVFNGNRGATISYRRCMFLAQWCEDQFGYRPAINHQDASFRTESDMTLFVTMWSGVPIERVSMEYLESFHYTHPKTGV